MITNRILYALDRSRHFRWPRVTFKGRFNKAVLWILIALCRVYNYESTSTGLPFDGRSTAYQRSLRSQWRNPLAAVALTYLFIQVAQQLPGRRVVVCDRIAVEWESNGSRIAVELQSNESRIAVELQSNYSRMEVELQLNSSRIAVEWESKRNRIAVVTTALANFLVHVCLPLVSLCGLLPNTTLK